MEYLNTRQVMKRFGWTTRAMVSRVALQEGWEKKPRSRPREYLINDVKDYAVTRQHTDLARSQGHVFRGLLRHKNGHSASCPVCKKNTSIEGVTKL